jgi:hypothetical protein
MAGVCGEPCEGITVIMESVLGRFSSPIVFPAGLTPWNHLPLLQRHMIPENSAGQALATPLPPRRLLLSPGLGWLPGPDLGLAQLIIC